jgi:hypothetical protein
MDLVKAVLRIDFSEALHPWLDLRRLVRAATGDQSIEIQGQQMNVDRAGQHQRVVLEVRALTIHQEHQPTLDAGAEAVLAEVVRIHEAFPLPSIRSMRFDAFFIEAYPLPFHELVARFRESFIQTVPITAAASDIGLLLDYRLGQVVQHLQLGPMAPAQLQAAFLIWPRDRLPEQFLYVSAGYEEEREMPFDRGDLARTLATASQWQLEQATLIRDNLFGVRGN